MVDDGLDDEGAGEEGGDAGADPCRQELVVGARREGRIDQGSHRVPPETRAAAGIELSSLAEDQDAPSQRRREHERRPEERQRLGTGRREVPDEGHQGERPDGHDEREVRHDREGSGAAGEEDRRAAIGPLLDPQGDVERRREEPESQPVAPLQREELEEEGVRREEDETGGREEGAGEAPGERETGPEVDPEGEDVREPERPCGRSEEHAAGPGEDRVQQVVVRQLGAVEREDGPEGAADRDEEAEALVVSEGNEDRAEGDVEEEGCGQERDRPETAVVRFGEGHARDRRGRPVVAVPQRAALFRRGAGACLGRDGALAFLAFFAGARAGVRSPKWAATCRR